VKVPAFLVVLPLSPAVEEGSSTAPDRLEFLHQGAAALRLLPHALELGEVALVDPLELRVAVVPVVAAGVRLRLLPVVRNQGLGGLDHLKPIAGSCPVLHRLGDDDGALERRDVLALSGYFGSLWRVYNIMRRNPQKRPLRRGPAVDRLAGSTGVPAVAYLTTKQVTRGLALRFESVEQKRGVVPTTAKDVEAVSASSWCVWCDGESGPGLLTEDVRHLDHLSGHIDGCDLLMAPRSSCKRLRQPTPVIMLSNATPLLTEAVVPSAG